MPRPPKCRTVQSEPQVTYFKPRGVPARMLETVVLGLDELEAIRLADLEGLYQEEAAGRMGISRPTFGRLVSQARQKVADALFNGKALVFEGGAVAIGEGSGFECRRCGRWRRRMADGEVCGECEGEGDERGSGGKGGGRRGGGQGRGRRRRGRD